MTSINAKKLRQNMKNCVNKSKVEKKLKFSS